MPVVRRSTVTAIFGLASLRNERMSFRNLIDAAGDLLHGRVVDLAHRRRRTPS